MSLIEFKNLPDTSTPINAENLNNNFNELLNSIIYQNVTSDAFEVAANGQYTLTLNFTIPSNYEVVGLKSSYVSGGASGFSILSGEILSNSSLRINIYNPTSSARTWTYNGVLILRKI